MDNLWISNLHKVIHNLSTDLSSKKVRLINSFDMREGEGRY
jgi:hypothetical protein